MISRPVDQSMPPVGVSRNGGENIG